MEDNNISMTGSANITIGDLIKSVASFLYKELDALILKLRAMNDLEARTIHLREYVAKSRKLLCELLALTRWQGDSRISKLFKNIMEIENDLGNFSSTLNLSQDALYIVHSDIFQKRSRNFEINIAKDIMAKGTYDHLPEVLLNGGLAKGPHIIPKASLVNDMSIYIRSKLLLSDKIHSDLASSEVAVKNGLLIIRHRKVYELSLSLGHLSASAEWVVVSVKILIENGAEEYYFGTYDRVTVERQLLDVLRNHMSVSDELLSPCSSRSTNAVEQFSNLQNSSSSETLVNKKPSRMTIQGYHALCLHAGFAVGLRALYAQASDMARTIWKGFVDIQFKYVNGSCYLNIQFWRGKVSREYQYELRIVQSRRATSMGHKAIWCELWLCLPSDDGSKGGPVADAVPCSDISQKLIAQDYILDGVAFSKLWSDVLVYCSSVKIDVLYKRLMLTSCVSHATNLGLQLHREGSTVNLSWGASSHKFAVDCRTGEFVASSHHINETRVQSSKACDSFLSEINNLEMEMLCQASFLAPLLEPLSPEAESAELPKVKSLRALPTLPLLSLNVLAVSLLSAHLATEFKRIFPIENLAAIAPALHQALQLEPPMESLVYNVDNFSSDCFGNTNGYSYNVSPPYSYNHPLFVQENKGKHFEFRNDEESNFQRIPNISSYFIISVSQSLKVSLRGVVTRRDRNSKLLALPSIVKSEVLDEDFPIPQFQRTDGISLSTGEHASLLESKIKSFIQWQQTLLQTALPVSSLGFQPEAYELHLAWSDKRGRSVVVLRGHGHHMVTDFFFIQSVESLARPEVASLLKSGKQLDHTQYQLIRSLSLHLGSASTSFHDFPAATEGANTSTARSSDDYIVHADEFVNSDLGHTPYCLVAKTLMQLSFQPIDSRGSDDDSDQMDTSSPDDQEIFNQLRSKFLDGIAKTFPMLAFLWLAYSRPCTRPNTELDAKSCFFNLLHLYPLPRTTFAAKALFSVVAKEDEYCHTTNTASESSAISASDSANNSSNTQSQELSSNAIVNEAGKGNGENSIKRARMSTHHAVGYVHVSVEYELGLGMKLFPSSKLIVEDIVRNREAKSVDVESLLDDPNKMEALVASIAKSMIE